MAKNDRLYGLHLPAKGKTWKYDFRVDGQRYSRSTRTTRYSDAVKVAAAAHVAARDGVTHTNQRRLPDMPLREVFGRYYNERASLLKSGDNLRALLAKMALALGPDKQLSQLTLSDLLDYQVKRRKQVSNRTVNYEVPELIRPVVKHAKKWGIDVGPLGLLTDSEWSDLKLQIPPPRTRAASHTEQAKLLLSLRKDYRPIILFDLMTGLRLSALLLKRDQIDWENGVFWYPKKSKLTGDKGWLPITNRMARLLRAEIKKGGDDCEWVFTYQARRGREGRRPITKEGLKSEMQRAVKRAQLKNWRLHHDIRHTTATEALRSTQNLALVQQLLGHSSIKQTSGYAHVLMNDLREGMEKR